jgi:hypothetical protein
MVQSAHCRQMIEIHLGEGRQLISSQPVVFPTCIVAANRQIFLCRVGPQPSILRLNLFRAYMLRQKLDEPSMEIVKNGP